MVAKKTADGKSRYYKRGSLPHASATLNSDVVSRRKKIIVVAEEEEEANEDENSNEGDQNESTEEQIEQQHGTQIILKQKQRDNAIVPFNKDLDVMLTSLNNSISRRGFKVTQDGLHIEYVNKNNEAEVSANRTPAFPTDIVLSSNTSSSSSYSRITTATLPTCPFVTTDYYDKIVATDDNSTNVNRLMMKCANYFCDALVVQEKVVDLERQIRELKQKQKIFGVNARI